MSLETIRESIVAKIGGTLPKGITCESHGGRLTLMSFAACRLRLRPCSWLSSDSTICRL